MTKKITELKKLREEEIDKILSRQLDHKIKEAERRKYFTKVRYYKKLKDLRDKSDQMEMF